MRHTATCACRDKGAAQDSRGRSAYRRRRQRIVLPSFCKSAESRAQRGLVLLYPLDGVDRATISGDYHPNDMIPGRTMLADQFHEVAATARNTADADKIAHKLWRAHAEGYIADADATAVAEALQARRAVFSAALGLASVDRLWLGRARVRLLRPGRGAVVRAARRASSVAKSELAERLPPSLRFGRSGYCSIKATLPTVPAASWGSGAGSPPGPTRPRGTTTTESSSELRRIWSASRETS